MLFQIVCLAALLSVQISSALPLQDEKIEPVKLSHFCTHTQVKGEEHNKSAVILIHGFGGSAQHWDGVREVIALQTGRRVCAIDLRNHGESPWNNRSDVAAMAVDIGSFLDSEKIQKVNIIGHSLGGKVSMHYTLNNPERVNSLVVEDSRPNGISKEGAKYVKQRFQLLREAIKTAPSESNEDEAKKIIVDYINARIKELGLGKPMEERNAKHLQLRCIDGKWQYKMNIDLFNKRGDIYTISSGLYEGPTLFIYGKASIFDIPADKENILKLFPNAKLVGVEGAGHQIHGKFREFDDEVIRFLNSLDS